MADILADYAHTHTHCELKGKEEKKFNPIKQDKAAATANSSI